MRPTLIKVTTKAVSLRIILRGQLAFMNRYFDVLGITSYDDKHFNEIANQEGIRTKAIDLVRGINLIKDLKALLLMVFTFLKEKPDIVHTHTPKAGLLGMLAAWLVGVPVRLHNIDGMPLVEARGFKKLMLNYTEKLTYRCSNFIYPNSFGLQDIIIKNNFCPRDKIKVIANGGTNGIDAEYFSANVFDDSIMQRKMLRDKLCIGDDNIVLLFVGRIAVEKGIRELTDVFEDLQTRYPIKLLLIGPYEKEIGVLSNSYKIKIESNKNILLLGRFDDVRPYYLMSDIFVLPSYREGLPGSVLEAGAMDLPCIVTDINGCNEIIKNEFNGLLVKPKDRDSLKKAMIRLINDEKLRRTLSNNARNYVVDKYNHLLIWNSLLEEYRSHLKRAKIDYEV